ncbi:hypothetical protein HH1059_20190 [Halorhodospira halochloris]|uniref:Uncharacterized protein n=1 Tax=Halorhodospira halochloris TaxID=1052 RepID=A0A2Z6EZV6_HALHR|nr:hypothetical protein [Halorhodospira halochloris]BBE11148.1 hypothetical protein HH1059_20190 [Halorhodospira halochloris]
MCLMHATEDMLYPGAELCTTLIAILLTHRQDSQWRCLVLNFRSSATLAQRGLARGAGITLIGIDITLGVSGVKDILKVQ